MKFDQLHYFVETAKRQHVGQAANFLNISPSAISHSITALEAELGTPLFVKHGRQIKLTSHGKILLDRAELLLAEVDRIRDELSSDQLKMRGHYRIAATHVLCSEFVTPTWMDIQKSHPNLTAVLSSLRSGEVLAKINAREIDLGICFCPQSDPNHEQEVIHTGRLVFCFGKQHPFLSNRRVKDLELYPSIVALAAQGIVNCEHHHGFQKLQIQPKIINRFDSYDVAIRAIKSNTVWALLPDFLAYNHSNEIETYTPEDWDFDYTVAAIWPKDYRCSPALNRLIEKMRQSLREAARY